MASILFVDDDKTLGGFTKECLEEAGHSVDWVQKDSWTLAAKEITAKPRKTWDLLVLDIHYPREKWGGIWLYNDLVQKGFGTRWKNQVLVFSIFAVPDLQTSTASDSLALRVFLATAGIPFGHALWNQDFDRATLLEKVRAVLKRRKRRSSP